MKSIQVKKDIWRLLQSMRKAGEYHNMNELLKHILKTELYPARHYDMTRPLRACAYYFSYKAPAIQRELDAFHDKYADSKYDLVRPTLALADYLEVMGVSDAFEIKEADIFQFKRDSDILNTLGVKESEFVDGS